MHVDSNVVREPSFAIGGGRGGEPILQFKIGGHFRRARILSTRPVSEKARSPDDSMTHLLEYIVGGKGQVWARLDERKKTLRFEMPRGFEGEAELIKYELVEAPGDQEPAPGQYGIVDVSIRFKREPTFRIGRPPTSQPPLRRAATETRLQAAGESATRRGRVPALPSDMTYTPPTNPNVLPTRRAPSFGFGTAARMPKDRKEKGPEPGAYAPQNCWDGRVCTMRGRLDKDFSKRLVEGLEPAPKDRDPERGLKITRAGVPKWSMSGSGDRSSFAGKAGTTSEPGKYDPSYTLVEKRARAVTYRGPVGKSKDPQAPPDPQFVCYSLFAKTR